MADEARRRVDAADVEKRGQGGERNVFKERHVDEDLQPQRAVERCARRRAAKEQQSDKLRCAEEKAQAGDGDAAEARRALFAEHAVKREHGGGQNGEQRARGVKRSVNGVDDDERGGQFKDKRDNMVFVDLLVQQEMREHCDEDRIAGEDDRDDGRARIGDGHLIERHGDDDAQKARARKEAKILACEYGVFLPDRAHGEGNEQYAADEKAQAGDLHGGKHAMHRFEHNLHCAEDHGAEDDKNIAGTGTVHNDSPFIHQTKAVYAIFRTKARAGFGEDSGSAVFLTAAVIY